jgi:hypothetical protein
VRGVDSGVESPLIDENGGHAAAFVA